jgi:hypothetical protein
MAYVTALGALIMLKKFYEIDTCGQFHKSFLAQFMPLWHIALSFDLGYTARGINYTKKVF